MPEQTIFCGKKTMRILMFSLWRADKPSGAILGVKYLAHSLARLGHEVTIAAPSSRITEKERAMARSIGVSLLPIELRLGGFSIANWRQLATFMRRPQTRPDIVHFQYVRHPHYVSVNRLARKLGIPTILSFRGGWLPRVWDTGLVKKTVYWHLLERPFLRSLSAYHFVTAYEKEEMEPFLPRKPFFIVPNPLWDVPTSRRWKPHIGRERRVLGYLGRFDIYNKGLDRLFEVIRLLQKQTKVELRLLGKPRGKHESRFRRLIESAGDLPIRVCGEVYDEEKKANVYLSFDLYIQFSRWELWGHSIAEAMSLGVPVAITDRHHIARMAGNAGACLVLPFDDVESAAERICRLLNSTEQMTVLARRGLEWVQKFRGENIARRMLEVYQECIKMSTRRGAM